MSFKESLAIWREKIREYRLVKELFIKFKDSQIIPYDLLTDVVLKKVIANFIKRAEEKGWTAGIDLPQEEIADYILRIIKGDKISYKKAPSVNQVIDLIRKSVFSD